MAAIKTFEELQCWQSAMELVVDTFELSRKLEGQREFEIKSQIKRASLSVMNNIAEGFGRFSDQEFIRYLNIAAASAIEVKSMIYLLNRLNIITDGESEKIHSRVDDTKKLVSGLIRYLEKKRTGTPEHPNTRTPKH